jgi:hypothetical protein
MFDTPYANAMPLSPSLTLVRDKAWQPYGQRRKQAKRVYTSGREQQMNKLGADKRYPSTAGRQVLVHQSQIAPGGYETRIAPNLTCREEYNTNSRP